MDPVTHLASGVLGAQVARRWLPGLRFFVPFCMLAAWIPDIDIFFDGGDPRLALLYHRGPSHSLITALALAALFALGGKLAWRDKASAARLWVCAYLLICVHLWLDLVTNYGTSILWPLTDHRFALDAVFIIDPVLTLGIIGFITASARARRVSAGRAFAIAMAGLVFVFAYPIANLSIRATLTTFHQSQLEEAGEAVDGVHLLPDAFTPYYWKVVIDRGETYEMWTENVLAMDASARETFAKADAALLGRLGRTEPLIATWQWFTRFAYEHASGDANGGSRLVLGDLRFASANPVLARIMDRDPPFTLILHFDAHGDLASYDYPHNGETLTYRVME